MSDILINVTTLDDFENSIKSPEIKLHRAKDVSLSEYNALSPSMSNTLKSFLIGIPASMVASFLMEQIQPYIKTTGNEVIIQTNSVQIKLDKDSKDVDFQEAALLLTPNQ